VTLHSVSLQVTENCPRQQNRILDHGAEFWAGLDRLTAQTDRCDDWRPRPIRRHYSADVPAYDDTSDSVVERPGL
jgi:hypothetical protein